MWNPNCVIALEQTLVLPVIPQTAGSVCVCMRVCLCESVSEKERKENERERKLNEFCK